NRRGCRSYSMARLCKAKISAPSRQSVSVGALEAVEERGSALCWSGGLSWWIDRSRRGGRGGGGQGLLLGGVFAGVAGEFDLADAGTFYDQRLAALISFQDQRGGRLRIVSRNEAQIRHADDAGHDITRQQAEMCVHRPAGDHRIDLDPLEAPPITRRRERDRIDMPHARLVLAGQLL